MKVTFTPAKPADLAFKHSLVTDPTFRAAYFQPESLQAMREGTAVLTGLPGVRQTHPEVIVTAAALAGLPCEWFEGSGANAGGVILYLHGGAFIRGNLNLGRANASWVAQESGHRVVALGYRQAPEYPYPAATDDVWNAWQALLRSGFDAHQVVVLGESSGGCLALGLAARLAMEAGQKPPGAVGYPAGIAALSPMVDLELRGASWLFNAAHDVADIETGRRAINLYVDALQKQSPVASPVNFHFRGCCPVYVAVGSHETMLSDTERLAHRADAAQVDVTFAVYDSMPHGFTRFDMDLSSQALADAAHWCRIRLAD